MLVVGFFLAERSGIEHQSCYFKMNYEIYRNIGSWMKLHGESVSISWPSSIYWLLNIVVLLSNHYVLDQR